MKKKMIYAFNILPTSASANQPLQTNVPQKFTIAEADMQKAMTSFFGPNVTYEKNMKYAWSAFYSFQSAAIISMNYNQTTGQFEGQYSGGGDEVGPQMYAKLIGASKKENEIILKEKYIMHDPGFDPSSENWTQTIYKNDTNGVKSVINNKMVNVKTTVLI